MLKSLLPLSGLLLGAASLVRTPAASVDLALVLAIDASGSVSNDRMTLQIHGCAHAIENPKVIAAVRAGRHGRIAVTFVQWSGRERQDQVIDWTLIEDEPSARSFAAAIMNADRPIPGATSISGAIDFSVKLFADCGYRATRRVIDISGDGRDNDGDRDVTEARDDAVAAGITINGLPILGVEEELDLYYQQEVIGGPDAFMIAADGFASFGNAILHKLIREIAFDPRPSVRQSA
jgi:Protein of unknown function (DUF1194)